MTVDTRFGSYPDSFAKYVRPSELADADHAFIRKQANELVRDAKDAQAALRALHAFVAALPTGFDREDLPASAILRKRRGQCNTKATLFVALARAAGIPCRLHAWRIRRGAHKPHLPLLVYAFAPKVTLFAYPEVYHEDAWKLLGAAIAKRGPQDGDACPFDDASSRASPLREEWIVEDLGSFPSPDALYKKHGTNTDGWRRLAFPFVKPFLNAQGRTPSNPRG